MGRALWLKVVYIGTLGQCWVGTGIALPGTHPVPTRPHHPGYTLPTGPGMLRAVQWQSQRAKVAVGLKSVAQLSLYARISGFLGITEVYNLLIAGNANDHNVIPGIK